MYCCTSSASLSCLLQALPEERLEAVYENGFVDYRALLCQQGGQCLAAEDIDRYHRSLGWKCCGYHYVIPTDGTIEAGRPPKMIGAHCKSHNSHSIGICYIGGLDADGKTPKDTRTEAQKVALRKLIEHLHQRYPKALIVGHHDLNPQKTCPCFNVTAEYIDLQP